MTALTNRVARRRLRQKLSYRAAAILRPPPIVTVSECADLDRIISPRSGAVEPGQWFTSRTPYLREVMDTLGDPSRRRVVLMKSSQVGGSEVGLNWWFYVVLHTPATFLWLCPTQKALRLFSSNKLDPLIEDTPKLRDRVISADGGRRDQRETMSQKMYPGGTLNVLAGRSSGELRALSAPFGVADEIDELDTDLAGQGDPLKLLERAIRNFLRMGGKLFLVSTPTMEGFSRIDAEYEASDQRHFEVPCPHCGHRQPLEWRDEDKRYRLVCDRDQQGELLPDTAQYLCRSCERLIPESAKGEMLEQGTWRATFPERPTAGFHLNTLYSPFVTWAEMVREFLTARKTPSGLKTFDNLWVGLPSKESADAIDHHFLENRAESYGDGVEVPHGVGIITGGVDVQSDHLELVLVGHGAFEEKWWICWEQFTGDPALDDVWLSLDEFLKTPRRHASGALVPVSAVGVDAGYLIDRAFKFSDARTSRNIFPAVGRSGPGKRLLKAPDPKRAKKTRAQTRPVHTLGADTGKDLLYRHLIVTKPGPQCCHFPETFETVFYDQLVSEKCVTGYRHGRPIRVWKLPEGRRNEAQDCTLLAMGALVYLGPLAAKQIPILAKKYSEFVPSEIVKPAAAPAGYGMVSKGVW